MATDVMATLAGEGRRLSATHRVSRIERGEHHPRRPASGGRRDSAADTSGLARRTGDRGRMVSASTSRASRSSTSATRGVRADLAQQCSAVLPEISAKSAERKFRSTSEHRRLPGGLREGGRHGRRARARHPGRHPRQHDLHRHAGRYLDAVQHLPDAGPRLRGPRR